MKLKGVRLIIFDLDDTLMDNREVDYQSFAVVCRKHLVRPPSRGRLFNHRNQGVRADDIIRMVWSNRSDSFLEQVKKERLELLASGKLWLRLAQPFPGVAKFLANLKKQKISVVIVTIRKNRRLIKQLLQERGWQQQIDFLFCGDDISDSGGVKTHASNALKLKRMGYIMAMKKFKVKREQVLVIGDDPDDLQAAYDLRISCIRVRNSYKESLFDVTTKGIPVIETIADLRITD
jgi:phosphoglycolate phosphatase-like HAD superfamily hydrolase